jgi:condensin complex subunit 3
MLSQETLPEGLLTKCLDVLRELSASERDLIRVVVEVIQDLREPGDEGDEDAAGVSFTTNYPSLTTI